MYVYINTYINMYIFYTYPDNVLVCKDCNILCAYCNCEIIPENDAIGVIDNWQYTAVVVPDGGFTKLFTAVCTCET